MKNKYKNSADYWKDREKERIKKGDRDIKQVEKQLVKLYKENMQEIKKEILNFYDKFAKDNNLTYAEACRVLNAKEFKEFRMDIKDYIKLIKETGDEQLLLELNTLSTKSRISRLEELFYECGKYINEIYETSEKHLQTCFSSTVRHGYYSTIYDTHKLIGVGTTFAMVDDKLLKDVMSYPWSGRNWSSRIWSNRSKLNKVMQEEISKMIIQGKSAKDIAKSVSIKMDSDFSNAMRLVRTEHSYFMNEGAKTAYTEMNMDKYMFIATLDNRTCDCCGKLDGQVFLVSEAMAGVNYVPMHPRCRSTTIPHIDNAYTERIARDSNNKNITVSASMTYEEWKKIYKIKD